MADSLVRTDRRPLGSLAQIGPLAYGCWRFTTSSVAEATTLIETALELGMNLIDTADVYGLDWGGSGFGANEELLGAVLEGSPRLREQMVLATKGGIVPPLPYDSSRDALTRACEASLRRLRVDTIDLYQVHRPDMLTHPAEVAATLSALREAGKIREVGLSNHSVAQHDALAAHLDFPIASTQPEFSASELAPMRDGTFDRCQRDGVTVLAWSPLAGGRLMTGEGVRPELISKLDELAEREGMDRAAIAYAFVLAFPAAPVAILGTQNPERLRAATRALGVKLDRADVYAVIQASEGAPLP